MISAQALPLPVSPREGYELWAATYDSERNPVVALQERMLRALLPAAHGKTVVDVGCGTGRTLSLWGERNAARVIGIDLSLAMLRRARGVSECVVEADARSIPLCGGSADIVSCCLTLGYLRDLEAFASEVARVVGDGGVVFISELHPRTAETFSWQRGFRDRDRWVNIDFRNFPIEEVIGAFADHGFEADLRLEVPFGTLELSLFEAAGKRERFDRFRERPAIYVLRLRRSSRPAADFQSALRFDGARIALSATESATASVTVAAQDIASIGVDRLAQSASVNLAGYLLLPGLINAHDHLEFALFPRLGRGTYHNSREWAEDIYRPDESPLREQLQVPKWVRLWWGGIRNLLCGVTTVCHHNPYEEPVFTEGFPVRVLRNFSWAHSVAFDPELVNKHAQASANIPFIVHAGEGTDAASREELRRLANDGVLDERTVIVHGNGFDSEGLELLNRCGAALVWCPSSNTFLFDQTLSVDRIDGLSRKALGSDSPLTSRGDLLDEIRFAMALGAPPELIFDLVTWRANDVLLLKRGEGQVMPGAVADFLAVRDGGLSPAGTLASLAYEDVELVVVDGRVRLVSEELKSRLPEELVSGLEPLRVNGVVRWVRAPVGELLRLARQALGPEIRMSGRLLSQ